MSENASYVAYAQGMDTLTPVAPHTFRIESRNGFGAPGELAIFELGPDGLVA